MTTSFPLITAVPRSVKCQFGVETEQLTPLDGSSCKSSTTILRTLSLSPREPETPVDRMPPTVIHFLLKNKGMDKIHNMQSLAIIKNQNSVKRKDTHLMNECSKYGEPRQKSCIIHETRYHMP